MTAEAPAGNEARFAMAGSETCAAPMVNPATGLATDYLNHFNEAIMLLDMLADGTFAHDCLADFLAWAPKTYYEHFEGSQFSRSDLVIAAYEAARGRLMLDALASDMVRLLTIAGEEMRAAQTSEFAAAIARRTVVHLKEIVVQAGAVINGATAI